MKTYRSRTLNILFLVGMLISMLPTSATVVYGGCEKFEKKISKEYNVNADAKLEIKNKYGKIHINTWDQSKVSIDVVISIDSRSQEGAQKVFDKIDIEMSGTQTKVKAETVFNSKVKDDHENKDLHIDYTINIPRNSPIELRNRFGDIYVGDILGSCSIDLAYGNMRAGSLDSKENNIELQFSEGEIKFIALGKVDIQYSEMEIDKAGSLEIKTQFSELTVGPTGELDIDSQYDEIKLAGAGKLKIDTQFSEVDVAQLAQQLTLINAYGEVEIDVISADMTDIYVDNQFGSVELGMPKNVSYLLDAKGSFADIDLPDRFNVKEKTKGTTSFHYIGTVGSDPGKRTVTIITGYGEVELSD